MRLCRYNENDAGLSNSSKNQAEFVESPFHIDRWAVIFLFVSKELCEQEGIVLKIGSKEVENRLEELSKEKHARIFMHLIKEFYLIDGHKFGCTFLAYDADPETYHAKHLIFIDEESLNHMSRLSGIAKKIGLIATLNQENEVRLLQVERLNSRRE